MSNQDKPAFPVVSYMQPQGIGVSVMEIKGGMSLREYAAIKLRVPDSGTDWLDAMIEKSLLNEFAGKAMQAVIVNSDRSSTAVSEVDQWVGNYGFVVAQAMLKASKGE